METVSRIVTLFFCRTLKLREISGFTVIVSPSARTLDSVTAASHRQMRSGSARTKGIIKFLE